MSEHARLSPSNKRWPYCPGSVREEANYPNVAGDAAIDGTGSHLLLEICITEGSTQVNDSLIKGDTKASKYDKLIIGANHEDKPTGWLVDTERCKRVQICLDYITRRKEELEKLFPGCEVIVESESKSNPGGCINRDDWWGTCDITVRVLVDGLVVFIEVVDYKDGRGYVSEKWNNQLIAYLIGKLHGVNGDAVPDIDMRMTIVQPKTGTPIRYLCSTNPDHGLNKASLLSKIIWLTECAKATDDPNAPLIPGKHCQWCKHNPKRDGTCTSSTEKSIEVIETMTTDIAVLNNDSGLLELMVKSVSDIKSITPENLAKIADSRAGFDAVFHKVVTEIQEKIESGVEVPGYAMLPGNARKIWNESDDIIAKKLKAKRFKKDEIFPSKLISPAAALKNPNLTEVQKKKLKSELISEVVGENTLKKVAYEKPEKDTNAMFLDAGVIKEELITDKKETVSFF